MSWSSRERMLAALNCKQPDHTPCCFMLFKGLREECANVAEFVERQLAMGLDVTVAIPMRPMRRPRPMPEIGNLRGLPVEFPPDVAVRDWREERQGARPLLHREYITPSGRLHTAVELSEDFTHNDRIALFDDFAIPRAVERLVWREEHLAALRHVLALPTGRHIAEFRENARRAKQIADKHGLLVTGEWGVLFDAACWLCGMQEMVMMMMEQPVLAAEVLDIVAEWNRRRMTVMLDAGLDLFIRRAWYETADFLSPEMYRRFILPHVRRDADLAHAAGARLGSITTSGYMPLLDLMLDAGIDALIGLDPLQDAYADFPLLKQKTRGRMCLWGGVNGCVTIELGSPEEVQNAVRSAMTTLAPGGGFILSPVDNVIRYDEPVQRNVLALIDAWRSC
ncbi:MAG TPA: uroporphyrinogen decarboxylase family protein [Candidatus Bathyarchaeia archaeon]|nr:uroporphyrinogen decarboxylase family protein [Candidatus Bathyarchaeia archaeon]